MTFDAAVVQSLHDVISLDADASGLINDALTDAKHVCNANVGVAPEVVICPDNGVDEEGRRGGGEGRGGGGAPQICLGRPKLEGMLPDPCICLVQPATVWRPKLGTWPR